MPKVGGPIGRSGYTLRKKSRENRVSGGGGRGERVGCVRRIEVIVKMQKKKSGRGQIRGGGGGGGSGRGGGQGRCVRRIEVIVKTQKGRLGVSGGMGLVGGRGMNVCEELKLL